MGLDEVLANLLEGLVIDVGDLFEDILDDDYEYALELLKTIDESPASAEGVMDDIDQFPALKKAMTQIIADILDTGRGIVKDAIK